MDSAGAVRTAPPLAAILMKRYATPTSVGVWETFVTMGLIYFVALMLGAFGYRVPPEGWRPAGWTLPMAERRAMITTGNVHVGEAVKTPQFWLLWWVLCLNVSAGIGVIGMASPMIQ